MVDLAIRPNPVNEEVRQVSTDLSKVVEFIEICASVNDEQLPNLDRQKFSRILVLICVASTRDAQELQKLCGYDEGDVMHLVRKRMQRLRDLPSTPDEGTWEHQLALIRSVFELTTGMKDHRQPQLLDTARTFQQNRQTYLSILDIDSDATCVETAEFAELIGRCKVFQMRPKVEDLRRLVRQDYLPVHTRENLPWEAVCDVAYTDAQRFTAFAGSIAHEFGCNNETDHEFLLVIFRRRQSTRLGLPGPYLNRIRSRLRNKIRDCQAPNRLVLYMAAAFALCKDGNTQYSIHEFLNCETNDVSRATIISITRALGKAMRSWPVRPGLAVKFVSALLGDTVGGNDGKTMCSAGTSTYIDWENYWYSRIESQSDHDFAMAMVRRAI